ncbi:MAG TPA: caspase family protein [Candidatus Obscuribacterales bacterium]
MSTFLSAMKARAIKSSLLSCAAIIATSFFAPELQAQEASQEHNVNRPLRDKWALVVGISEFADPKLKLNYAAKDARDFAEYLIKECGFARDHVRLLIDKDATERRILSELGNRWLPRVANPDDLVIIYISTHGSGAELDLGGQNYLIAYDTDVNDLYTTGIPMQRLAQDIKDRVHCDRVVVFLDACHSGATKTGAKGLFRSGVDAGEFAVGSGQLVIASSKDDQVSWEAKNRPNSVFTATLLDALRSKGSRTTLGEMFESLKDGVQDTVLRERGVLQTPVMSSQWKGNDLVIAAEPTRRRPGLDEGLDQKEATVQPLSLAPHVSAPGSTLAHAPHQRQASSAEEGGQTSGVASRLTTSPVHPPGIAMKVTPPVDSSAIKTTSLIIPGKSLGRTQLGMSSEQVLNLLGKPTETSNNVLTYRAADRRLFVSMRFVDNRMTEVAFSSPVFTTATGIRLSNFHTMSARFKAPVDFQNFRVYTLGTGGLTIAVPLDDPENPVGIVGAFDAILDDLSWIPRSAAVAAKAQEKPQTAVLQPTSPRQIEQNAGSGDSRANAARLVPGNALGKTRLSMSKAEVLRLLGTPNVTRGGVITYWTTDKRYFLSLRFQQNQLTDVAFTSPAFSTSSGLNVSNFASTAFRDQFLPPARDNSGNVVHSLKTGGLSFVVTPDGVPTGWLYGGKLPAARFFFQLPKSQ